MSGWLNGIYTKYYDNMMSRKSWSDASLRKPRAFAKALNLKYDRVKEKPKADWWDTYPSAQPDHMRRKNWKRVNMTLVKANKHIAPSYLFRERKS